MPSRKDKRMKVSVVIITRNRRQAALECLSSVAAQDYANIEVLVVDNASADDTVEAVQRAYPAARVLPQKENTGVAGGRNIGMREATGDLCLCIDDDAVFLDSESISRCVPYFEKDEKLAFLALRIVDQYGNVVKKLIPRRDRARIAADAPGANFSGTGFMLRRSAFIALGGFWEKLNPYFGEEPELCWRALDAGWHITHTPYVSVRHFESPTERPAARRLYYGVRNTPWMAVKNLPWPAAISLWVLTWGYFFLMAARHGQMLSFLRAVLDCLRGLREVHALRKPISRAATRALRAYSGLYFY
ncbi:MAG: glycosyltransferase family 2 protein [Rickettsiales bacterium]|nr:glycosyltransferase family 2 protein [Rickettsiales bacterium]